VNAGNDQIGSHIRGTVGHQLVVVAHHAFVHAADQGLLIAAAVTLAGAIVAVRLLPGPAPSQEREPSRDRTARATA
jgi:hypothetical protein